MELFVLALVVASLIRYCSHPGVVAGDIYAVFAYVLMFVDGLDTVSCLTQQFARLHDIARRVADDPQENVNKQRHTPAVAAFAVSGS